MLSVGLVQLGFIGTPHARAQEATDPYVQAVEALDVFMEHVAELRASLDRRWIDVDALALDLAFDDAEVIEGWVRRNVAYEPYLGVLRGATGTLVSQAGNALDQTVLLARLLGDAGYDVRIARAAPASDDTPTEGAGRAGDAASASPEARVAGDAKPDGAAAATLAAGAAAVDTVAGDDALPDAEDAERGSSTDEPDGDATSSDDADQRRGS